ncbi:hypothetical protein [Methanosarcina barkeri]|uniref:hypothetical protein n=1 Tax=Methanosarcina barkeri TaxID=2208 RepID=UPI00003C69AC|nr:hypothetical protein [Methanosarcina barkeri]
MRPLQDDVILKGNILYRGKNLYSIEKKDVRKLKSKEIGMLLQNPGSSLNRKPQFSGFWSAATYSGIGIHVE